MTARGFQHLTLDERRFLFRMQEARLGVTEMAARLGRHRSTIYRELGRNRFRDPDASWDIRAALGGLAQDLRWTVTFDRGFEFMGYPALDRGLAATSYFCDPHSRWQNGAIKNANGRLRRYLLSDVPAERLVAESLQALADRLTPHRVAA